MNSRAWPQHADRTYERMFAHSLGHVGAFDGDRLVGFVNVATDGGRHAFLLDTAVDRAYQRQGIGTQLVCVASQMAADAGCEWLHVDYEPRLDGFYRNAGFEPTAAGLMHPSASRASDLT